MWTSLISCLLHRWRARWLHCLIVASLCYIPAVTAAAQEIFWVGLLSVLAATCALKLILGKPTSGASEEPNDRSRTISIRNLLVLTGLIAGWVTVAIGTPRLNLEAIQSLLVLAFSCIAIPVAAMSLADSRRSRRIRWTIASVLTVAACSLSVGLDWLYISFTAEFGGGWPPDASTFALFGPRSLKPSLAWLIITPATFALVLIFVIYAKDARRLRCGAAIAVSVLAILPTCIVAAILSIPLATPQQPTGKNAMPDMLKLAKQFEQSNFEIALAGYETVSAMPIGQRAVLLAELEPNLELFLTLSNASMWNELGYGKSDFEMNFSDMGNARSAVRAVVATAEEKLYYSDFGDSSKCYFAALQTSGGLQRNGLLVHALIGSSAQSLVTLSIYKQHKYFDSQMTRQLIDELAAVVQEPISEIAGRERDWMIRQNWHNYVSVLVHELAFGSATHNEAMIEDIFQRNSATLRLLALQMELELHITEHGNAPDSLDAIAKRYPELVLDPFAAKPARFIYRAEGSKVEIYSVGPNGIDDGGKQFWTPTDSNKREHADFNLETMMSAP